MEVVRFFDHPNFNNQYTQPNLVYNGVPKCSSTSMYKLIKALSLRINFRFSLARSDDIRTSCEVWKKRVSW